MLFLFVLCLGFLVKPDLLKAESNVSVCSCKVNFKENSSILIYNYVFPLGHRYSILPYRGTAEGSAVGINLIQLSRTTSDEVTEANCPGILNKFYTKNFWNISDTVKISSPPVCVVLNCKVLDFSKQYGTSPSSCKTIDGSPFDGTPTNGDCSLVPADSGEAYNCDEAVLDDSLINWTGPDSVSMVLGETETLTYIANSKDPSIIIKSIYTNNDKSSDLKILSQTANSITFQVDSASYFDKTEQYDYGIKLFAETNKATGGGYFVGGKTIPVHFDRTDCAKPEYNSPEGCAKNAACFYYKKKCEWRFQKDDLFCRQIIDPEYCQAPDKAGTPSKKGSLECKWNEKSKVCEGPLAKSVTDRYQTPAGYTDNGGILPPCSFSGTCNDTNDLLQLVINTANWLLGIVGLLAFIFFMYGGFTMLISFGSQEKTKKGMDILIAAGVGLIIVFAAFLLVRFMISTIGVKGGYVAEQLK